MPLARGQRVPAQAGGVDPALDLDELVYLLEWAEGCAREAVQGAELLLAVRGLQLEDGGVL